MITAAGSGARFGADMPKALVPMAGVPLLGHGYSRITELAGLTSIVVTYPPGHAEAVAAAAPGATLVGGGSSRQESVRRALEHVNAQYVLIHDAARPLASTALMTRILTALQQGAGAVVPALPVADTIKQVEPAGADSAGAQDRPHGPRAQGRAHEPGAPDWVDSAGAQDRSGGPNRGAGETDAVATHRVTATLARAELRAVQTPQGFRTEVLRRVHAAGAHRGTDETISASDDAALVEEFSSVATFVVAGEEQAMKITTEKDLMIAETMLEAGYWS